jgi:hypothetical protein
MLVCATCGSRWDEDALPAVTLLAAVCPLCEGALVDLDDAPLDDAALVRGDVASVLREHLLGVGA